MLTGLDFPLELFYGREGTWVRDDRAGAVRIGLHFFILDQHRQTVVSHVQLPKVGEWIDKGEVFGHVDLDGATVPLVAPVSGTVFVPNPQLRDDADLLRSDAFGEGYLLDLEDVPKDELLDLLDPDEAMAHYSTFPADDEKPSAQMVMERDRPWFTSLDFGFGGRMFARAKLLPPKSNETFVPDWQLGESWKVSTLVGGVERFYRYTYKGELKVAGEMCKRVEAVEEVEDPLSEDGVALEPPPIKRVLYFRVDSFTLLAYDIVPVEAPTLYQRIWNERGEACFMHFGAEDGFFLDHPFLPPGRLDFTREYEETPKSPALSDHNRFRGGGTRCEVEFRARIVGETGLEERWFSQQIWIAGSPWWREAVRMCGDKVLIKAALVTDEPERR